MAVCRPDPFPPPRNKKGKGRLRETTSKCHSKIGPPVDLVLGDKLEKWFPLGERAQSLKVYNIRMSVFKNSIIEMRKRR